MISEEDMTKVDLLFHGRLAPLDGQGDLNSKTIK